MFIVKHSKTSSTVSWPLSISNAVVTFCQQMSPYSIESIASILWTFSTRLLQIDLTVRGASLSPPLFESKLFFFLSSAKACAIRVGCWKSLAVTSLMVCSQLSVKCLSFFTRSASELDVLPISACLSLFFTDRCKFHHHLPKRDGASLDLKPISLSFASYLQVKVKHLTSISCSFVIWFLTY